MLRYRQRRYCLTALGVFLLWGIFVAAIVHLTQVEEERPAAAALPVAIRTRQGVLPVRRNEVEQLKELPLRQWTDKQRTLLNMTYRPWLATSSNCSRLSTGFASGPLPLTGLVSLPSSGNTWLRGLIEDATGIFTGSMYSDLTIVMAGMYGELVPPDSATTVAQKTHGFTTLEGVTASADRQRREFSHVRELQCRAVLLVREPMAATVSHRHLDAAGHLGFAPLSHFQGEGWQSFVEQKALFWYRLYAAWIEQCPPDQLLLVLYERLKSDLPTEMNRVLNFLGVKPDRERLDCIYRYPRGSMQRRTRAKRPELKDLFTAEQKALMRERVLALDKLVRERGLGDGLAEYL